VAPTMVQHVDHCLFRLRLCVGDGWAQVDLGLLTDVSGNWTHGVIDLENWSDGECHVLRVQQDVCVGRSQVVVLGDGEASSAIGPHVVCDLAVYGPALAENVHEALDFGLGQMGLQLVLAYEEHGATNPFGCAVTDQQFDCGSDTASGDTTHVAP